MVPCHCETKCEKYLFLEEWGSSQHWILLGQIRHPIIFRLKYVALTVDEEQPLPTEFVRFVYFAWYSNNKTLIGLSFYSSSSWNSLLYYHQYDGIVPLFLHRLIWIYIRVILFMITRNWNVAKSNCVSVVSSLTYH